MHLKIFSLIETSAGSDQYVFSPAYDLLPVNVIMPEDTEEFALPMNGKKTNLRRKDFLVFADACGISSKAAEGMLSKVISMHTQFANMISESLLPEELKKRFSDLLSKRIEAIK